MSAQSIERFLSQTTQADRSGGGEGWELENDRILEIRLYNKAVWLKAGAMIAYRGAMRFERERLFEHGASRLAKRLLTGEGSALTRAQGSGRLYLADKGKIITVLALTEDSVVVNGTDVLAFDRRLSWDIRMMKRVGGMLTAGFFNLRFDGSGLLAISSHFQPMTLRVEPGKPVITDPHATVAWSSSLEPDIRLDVSLRTFLGRASGDSVQMVFEGEGFVVVQSVEERPLPRRR